MLAVIRNSTCQMGFVGCLYTTKLKMTTSPHKIQDLQLIFTMYAAHA